MMHRLFRLFLRPRKVSSDPQKVLLLKLGAMGDVLMTTPLIRQVKQHYPHAQIDYAVGKWSAKVLEGNSYLNQVIAFSDEMILQKQFFQWWRFSRQLREEGYDLVLVLDKHWIFNLWGRFLGKFTIGFDRSGEGWPLDAQVLFDKESKHQHYILWFLDLLALLHKEIDKNDVAMDFFVSDESRQGAIQKIVQFGLRNGEYVAIAPAGGNNPAINEDHEVRGWPLAQVDKLIERVRSEGHPVVLIGGPGDQHLVDKISSAQQSGVINLVGKLNLEESAYFLQQAQVVLCNDTGVMHLAATQTDRIVSIFGPTDPVEKAPLSQNATFIWQETEQVFDARGQYDPKRAKEAMRRVTVDDVWRAISKYL